MKTDTFASITLACLIGCKTKCLKNPNAIMTNHQPGIMHSFASFPLSYVHLVPLRPSKLGYIQSLKALEKTYGRQSRIYASAIFNLAAWVLCVNITEKASALVFKASARVEKCHSHSLTPMTCLCHRRRFDFVVQHQRWETRMKNATDQRKAISADKAFKHARTPRLQKRTNTLYVKHH